MITVIAALDASPAARPVLENALRFAHLVGSEVEAVHVRNDAASTPEWLADRLGVPLRVLDGDVVTALLGALDRSDVVALVVGARRTPSGRRPAGRTALRVLEHASKPVVVVPPSAVGATRLLRRVIVPLDGTISSAQPVLDRLCPLLTEDIELIVLHVFTAATLPRTLDHPVRDLALLGTEFAARNLPAAAEVEQRTGPVATQIDDLCRERQADLVVLSWSQDASPGHAAVVRDVLDRAEVPVLLLPTGERR